MLSRVADSVLWMSRYLERAENVARFIDVNLQLVLELPRGYDEQWEPLVRTTGDEETFEKRHGSYSKENVIQFLTFDSENPNSILSCLRGARENARSVREIISSEMWEQINRFYLMVNSAAIENRIWSNPHDFFTQVKMNTYLVEGITRATMSHGEPWHFCQLGQMIERADKTSRILDVKYFLLLPSLSHVGTTIDELQWAAVLRSASALEMYRKRHGAIAPIKVVDFLVLDREFPRAIHFCLDRAEESLHAISGSPIGTFRNLAEQRLGQLRSDFAYVQVQDIMNQGLHEFLDNVQLKLNDVGEAVWQTFLAPRTQQQAS